MSQTVERLFEAARLLSDADRGLLVDLLLATLGPEPPPAGPDWAEIKRRSDEFDAGLVKPIPWEEVKRQAREKFFGHD